jgi:glycosyltransferase involved in cell wall biosynthesis
MELIINEIKPPEPFLCLNMIVKDEAHIIKDTLDKLLNKIKFDYWVISDTGSTDDTKQIIQDFFKERNIEGELFDDEWKDFGHNRTKALEHAYNKSKYLLIFDADDEICGDFVLPNLAKDSYFFQFGDANGSSYVRIQIVNNTKKWKYIGVLHEIITCTENANSSEIITGNYYTVSGRTSSRNRDGNKYLKDALILEKAYEEALKNNDEIYNRYGFYCANSYYDSGKREEAIKWYKITLNNNNWGQEKYVSCLRLYNCYNALDQKETGFYYLVNSFLYDKERAEGVQELISHYCILGMNEVAYSYYSIVKSFYNDRYLKYGLQDKLFIDLSKTNFYLPYYMILVSDKMQDHETTIQMYRIIFTKKYRETNSFFVGNLLYNLQFFIERAKDDSEFISLFNEYINFLLSINYPVYQHDFMNKYEKYGIKIPDINNPRFSPDECLKSNKILFYTGYAPFRWNYSYNLNNALGGSETAVIYLSKSFPKNYEIYIAGEVEEETVDNIKYINLHNLSNLIKTTAFNTIIVSRYLNFYEIYPYFSAYKTFIWGHDICLFQYGTNLSVEDILKKWASKINGCVCQTEWHKNLFLSTYPKLQDKIYTINNGIHIEFFHSKNKKINNRFIYTSCTERGLDRLLELWPSITKNIEDAELFISSYNYFPSNENDIKLKTIIDSYPNIKHVGKLNKNELYNLMSTAEYWLYPTNFTETSCITSMEMLMSEVICIYYPIAGLVNTLGDYGIQVKRERN